MANIYPKIVKFLLADAVRQEQGGKLTMLGLYSGDSVLLNDPLPKVLPEGKQGLALPGLTIVATICDGQGHFDCSIHLFGPDGKERGKGANRLEVNKQKDASANLIFPMEPFPINGFGIYRIVLQLNKHEYEFKFNVRHADPHATFPKVKRSKKPALPLGTPMPGRGVARPKKSKTTPRKRMA
jgi:hypothetical protein